MIHSIVIGLAIIGGIVVAGIALVALAAMCSGGLYELGRRMFT